MLLHPFSLGETSAHYAEGVTAHFGEEFGISFFRLRNSQDFNPVIIQGSMSNITCWWQAGSQNENGECAFHVICPENTTRYDKNRRYEMWSECPHSEFESWSLSFVDKRQFSFVLFIVKRENLALTVRADSASYAPPMESHALSRFSGHIALRAATFSFFSRSASSSVRTSELSNKAYNEFCWPGMR